MTEHKKNKNPHIDWFGKKFTNTKQHNDFGHWTEPKELKRSKEVRDHGYERPELETAEQISMHHKLCKLHREFYDKYGWTPTLLGDMYDRD